MKVDGVYCQRILIPIVLTLGCLFIVCTIQYLWEQANDSDQKFKTEVVFFKKNKISGEAQPPPHTDLIFKGNFVSMYQFPITNETVTLVRNEHYELNDIAAITGENGEFELKYSLTQNDFDPLLNSSFNIGVYINISNQLIRMFPFQISKDFLQPGSITFDFTNKILEQTSKVQTFINGSVIDKNSLNSIPNASVKVIYYYPMMMAKMELSTNKVGYFEFDIELDYFEVIIAELIVSKEGYQPYIASQDPKFIRDKGITLYDKYHFSFEKSIKLEPLG